MKTDELISLLATGVDPVRPDTLRHRYATAVVGGVLGSALLMAVMLGVRPDIVEAAALPMFWVKLALPGTLLAAAIVAAMRLSRPGVRLGRVPEALAAPVVAIWLIAAAVLFGAAPGSRSALIFGSTWASCPISITLLSAPMFVAGLWAMKGLAPTRLALAGAAAGLLAGAAGAAVYALHCEELAAPFLAVWYVLGMLIPAAIGAALGPRVLRW